MSDGRMYEHTLKCIVCEQMVSEHYDRGCLPEKGEYVCCYCEDKGYYVKRPFPYNNNEPSELWKCTKKYELIRILKE